MKTDIFYRFGEMIYKLRKLIIIFWLLLLIICIPFAPKLFEPFKAIGFTDSKSESARANDVLNNKLGFSYNRFIVIYHSDKLLATNPKFTQEVKDSLSGLKNLDVKHQIIYPDLHNKQISTDKRTAYAVISFKGTQEVEVKLLEHFKSSVKQPPNLSMQIGGEPIFLDDTKQQTQIDLYKTEYIAAPVAIVTMLLVFGSVVAASIPIVLGAISALFILMILFCIAHTFSLSVFTINIALLLGLCLSLDYALLFINRYRDELHHGRDPCDAIAVTQATAGKAIFFSGLIVFISLSALLFFPINVLFSVGIGGLASVLVSVAVAIILLPAILAVLNKRINLLPIRILNKFKFKDKAFWHWTVIKVIKRPYLFFFTTLIFLLFVAYPFLNVKFGISDFTILPKSLESRQVFDTFKSEFGESQLSPILVIFKTPQKNMLTKKNIASLYDYADEMKNDYRVDQVFSIVNTEPRLSKEQYQMLYTQSNTNLNSSLQKLLDNTTHNNLTVMTVMSKYPSNSPETTALVQKIRNSDVGNKITLQVTGGPVNTIDVLNSISNIFPYAFLWMVVSTYLILLIFLRSIWLPLKAVLTTMLSLCVSYGVLVIVFQDGYFHHLFNFEPQGMLDISLIVIIFCALFGISMDYEVFLLTRIKEYYERTGSNIQSIEFGIERSGKIITSAAVIVILICFSFMAADILIVKALGLGIAVAVFVDAFIIRTILVPATMTILRKWNWYLPKWLDAILPKIAFDPEQYTSKKR